MRAPFGKRVGVALRASARGRHRRGDAGTGAVCAFGDRALGFNASPRRKIKERLNWADHKRPFGVLDLAKPVALVESIYAIIQSVQPYAKDANVSRHIAASMQQVNEQYGAYATVLVVVPDGNVLNIDKRDKGSVISMASNVLWKIFYARGGHSQAIES
jgi:hypothetical protein